MMQNKSISFNPMVSKSVYLETIGLNDSIFQVLKHSLNNNNLSLGNQKKGNTLIKSCDSKNLSENTVASENYSILFEDESTHKILLKIKMSIAHAITNLISINISSLKNIYLSVSAKIDLKDEKIITHEYLYKFISQFCSFSQLTLLYFMNSNFEKNSEDHEFSNSLITVKAYSPISPDINIARTTSFDSDIREKSFLLLIDLGFGLNRIGGSLLSKIYNLSGYHVPEINSLKDIQKFLVLIRILIRYRLILRCYDRSIGGLFLTIAKMSFSEKIGISVNLDMLTFDDKITDWGDYKIRPEQISVQRNESSLKSLFCEELGAVIQIPASKRNLIMKVLQKSGLSKYSHIIGTLNHSEKIEIFQDGKKIWEESIKNLCQILTE
ncbi:MAG: hypothetical protein IR526_00245 [Bordetella sp.]|nr:MAG: hypothetical protein IR526_00245 [Bordetella sp.]